MDDGTRCPRSFAGIVFSSFVGNIPLLLQHRHLTGRRFAGDGRVRSTSLNQLHLTLSNKAPTIIPSIDKKENLMQTTISSKYQVVIPKRMREHLNLKPQQKLTIIEKDKFLILIPQSSLEELRGIAAGAKVDGYREKKDRF
jgi:AbrB family looped-hinge helix DNA binding protein